MESIEKGKAGQIGEIRIWGGKKYHKTAKGWRPVPSQEQRSSAQLGDVRVWGGKEYVKTEKGWRPKPKGGSSSDEAEIVETKAFAINEFENKVNAFVKYKGKSYAVSATVPKEVNSDGTGYTIYAKEINYLNSDAGSSKDRDAAILRALRRASYSDYSPLREEPSKKEVSAKNTAAESRELSDILKDISYFKEMDYSDDFSQIKKEYAAKYGIDSKKGKEILQAMYDAGYEKHLEKTTDFNKDDLRIFSLKWDYPDAPAKLRAAFSQESDEFIRYYRDELDKTPSNRRYRGFESKLKAIDKILNERANSVDKTRIELIGKLKDQTAEFKDSYIKFVGEWAEKFYDHRPKAYQWMTKEQYAKKRREDADLNYEQSMAIIADRVRKMDMDESNIHVRSIEDDDYQYFNIYVDDGNRVAHARTILAAEWSDLVVPHLRFIITETGKVQPRLSKEGEELVAAIVNNGNIDWPIDGLNTKQALDFAALSPEEKRLVFQKIGYSGMLGDGEMEEQIPSTLAPTDKRHMIQIVEEAIWDNDPSEMEDMNHYWVGYENGKVISTSDITEKQRLPKKGLIWISAGGGDSYPNYWARDARAKQEMMNYLDMSEWKDGRQLEKKPLPTDIKVEDFGDDSRKMFNQVKESDNYSDIKLFAQRLYDSDYSLRDLRNFMSNEFGNKGLNAVSTLYLD